MIRNSAVYFFSTTQGDFMKLNLAENLKKLRKGRGITQEELANFIGVSFQAISKWERDEGYPDITLLPSIANFFNVTLDELLGMNEIQNQEK
jgi:transcriptional regulator with XRE-family HTH domain